MNTEISLDSINSTVPESIAPHEEEQGYLFAAMKTARTTSAMWASIQRTLRDYFYLPLNQSTRDPFIGECKRYAKQLIAILKGECKPQVDPTFPHLSKVIEHFHVRDRPIEIPIGKDQVIFHTRMLESQKEIDGKKLRLVLLSLSGNTLKTGESLTPWDPLHINELSSGVLDVLKAYQQQMRVDSLMCFSLGGVVFDGLKQVRPEESNFIPKTLIWNRALPSTYKAISHRYPFPISSILHKITSYLGFDANPEQELTRFFQRMQSYGANLSQHKMVAIEARYDTLFSGKNGLDPLFVSDLAQTGVSVSYGSFAAPFIPRAAHHNLRLDWITNGGGIQSEQCLPSQKHKTFAEKLTSHVFKDTGEDKVHTCMSIGGSTDDLDSMTVHALSLLSAYVS